MPACEGAYRTSWRTTRLSAFSPMPKWGPKNPVWPLPVSTRERKASFRENLASAWTHLGQRCLGEILARLQHPREYKIPRLSCFSQ